MTLIMLEGFDDYPAGNWTRMTTPAGGSSIVTTGGARTGLGYMGFGGTGSHQVSVGQEHALFAVGFGFRPPANVNADIISFNSDNVATEHVVLRRTSTGDLAVDRGATQLDITTTGGLVTANAWCYIELEALLSDTVGTVKVWVDGALVINLSGADTKNGGTKTVFDGWVHPNIAANWDDFYHTNGAGSLNIGRMGEIKVETKYMNGNGNYSQLVGSDADSTDNYLQVDEAGAPSSADYNGSATDGQIDTYTVEDLTITSGTIFGAEVRMYAAKTDAGAKSIRHVHRGGAADSAGADRTLATDYATFYDILEQYPNGPAAWTVTNFNASEFGVEVRP